MDKTGIFGQALGQLGDIAKKTGESVIKTPGDLAEAVVEQTGVKSDPTNTKTNGQINQTQSDSQSIQDTKDVVKELYGKSDNTNQEINNKSQQQGKSDFQEQIADKPIEEQKELLELRKKLHTETYYDPTFNPVKKQEERPAEKAEEEKKKEMYELKKKEEEKPQPLAVQMAQNKAERFPGASG
jgi:membrane protein involved in colicin uptake